MSEESSFSVRSTVPSESSGQLLDRIRRYYLLLHPERFSAVRRGKIGPRDAVAFDATDPRGTRVKVEMWGEDGLQVKVSGDRGVVEAARWLYGDLETVVRAVEEDLAGARITLIWVKGERVLPEEVPSSMRRLLGRLLSRTLLLLSVVLFVFNIILFLLFGIWAVVAILGLQLLLIVFADRFFGLMGKWTITPNSPQVYLLAVRVSNEVIDRIKARQVDLVSLKQAVFDASFAQGKEPSCSALGQTLMRFGVVCSEDGISIKVVNVLELVRRAARPYGAPLPKITISNSLIPNAAASGVSFRRGVLLLTGGILTQLNDEELVSVIGHELGHLKGRDPLLLYAIVSGEFLLRITVLLPLFLFSPLLYLILSTFLIFFVAKFFEARADLLSVMVLGRPKVMAESLRKIGFQRLQAEKASPLGSWFRWDTHPPLYFRIERLERMTVPVVVKHPLWQSAKDVLGGFRAAFSAH
ncbi:MAG: M48 family metalloprotease [Methanomassiliicoccus sp.]|nr:M48 family metalloprotease [Methanomassiliicoccus sp.]